MKYVNMALVLTALTLCGCSGGHKHDRSTAPVNANASLGDLSKFKAIAEDTLKIVKQGDLPAAKTRIKDLETEWDNAEEKLKPINSDKWTSIDKSIDRALALLRSGTPDGTACAASLEQLIAKFNAIDQNTAPTTH